MTTKIQYLDLFYEASSLVTALMRRLDNLRNGLHSTEWESDPQHTKLSRITDHAFIREQRRYRKYIAT